MKVLSLFDGMSCGQIALRQLMLLNGFENLRVEKYYASEIDKHAIAQTQHNFPDTVQLGDVERWREWDIDWENIDLIMGGSPCQGFSFAGKQLAFDDPRSRLFFVFADILTHARRCNPDVKFLLENVNMKKDHLRVISEYVGVFPVNINSALVSAQNRNRWYWTDICTRQEGFFGDVYSDIPQPEDRGIMLRDILEAEVDEKYNLSDKMVKLLMNRPKGYSTFTPFRTDAVVKSRAVKATVYKMSSMDNYIIQLPRGNNHGGLHEEKAPTLSANAWERNNMVIQLNGSKESGGVQPYQQNRVYDPAGKSPALMAGMSCGTHAILENTEPTVHNMMPRSGKTGKGGTGHLTRRDGKTYCLDTGQTNAVEMGPSIRRLTPTECARLQTIPGWYEWVCSETQQYRMLGNGWTVEVIKHILSCGQWKK